MKMDTYGQRLRYLIKLRGTSQQKLADKIGASQGMISKLCLDKSSETSLTVRIAKELNCDPFWLELNEGYPPDISMEKSQIAFVKWIDFSKYTKTLKDNYTLSDYKLNFFSLTSKLTSKCFALEIEDDSMVSQIPGKRSFLEKEIVIIDPEKAPQEGSFVLAKIKDYEKPIFRQYIIDAGIKTLKASNSYFEKILIDDKVEIVGIAIMHVDDLI